MTPEAVAVMFSIPDLIPALTHSLHRLAQNNGSVYPIGGRRYSTPHGKFPFENLEVWTGFRLQSKDYHNPDVVLPSKKLNVPPSSKDWPVGRFNTAIANVDARFIWPQSGLAGMSSCPCSIRHMHG
jgi:hypothetical protein